MTCARTSLDFSSAARDCSVASLRATSTTSWPCSAKTRASSRPMPLDAPVINAVIFLLSWGAFLTRGGPHPHASGSRLPPLADTLGPLPSRVSRTGRRRTRLALVADTLGPRVYLEQDVGVPAYLCSLTRSGRGPHV